jgi:hypothetical protein
VSSYFFENDFEPKIIKKVAEYGHLIPSVFDGNVQTGDFPFFLAAWLPILSPFGTSIQSIVSNKQPAQLISIHLADQ